MPEDNVIRIRLSLKGRPIKSYSFKKDVITVGRDPDADIYLDNPSISREHLRFERLPNGHFCVKDPGSANGSYLNEERVKGAMVYNNDVIRMGKFSLWISLERDRRGDRPREVPRAAADQSQGTMMLSTDEIERLMAITRESDADMPEPERRGKEREREPVEMEGAAEADRSRIFKLVGIGVVLILATSVGAGFAWLFLR
jgi:pSer/pThr/pTyr-binding forkhead associated (FHA) protein